jgi:inhibitor of cysteine peptidase
MGDRPPAGDDDGTPDDVMARVGDTFVVRLASNPTTGYSWHLAPDDHVEVAGEAFEGGSAGGTVGAGGVQVFTLRACRSGRVTLTFAHRRPWEQGIAPLAEHRVRVHVRR